MMKLALMRTATEMEDPELPLLWRISSLELPASEIAPQINASECLLSNRHISTSTVQRRLCERMIHMCDSHREAWRRRCAGVLLLFTIQGPFNQHGYHSSLQLYAIPSGLHLVGLSFVFKQDNDPTHLQAE
jgi:hypothetical protein